MTSKNTKGAGNISGSEVNRLVLLLHSELNILDQKRPPVCRPAS